MLTPDQCMSLSLRLASPFGLLLVAMALGPLLGAARWHRVLPMIVLLSVVTMIGGLGDAVGLSAATGELWHTLVDAYIPFICTAGAFFIIPSGVRVQFPGAGTPLSNTLSLGVGALLSSWLGTTGASMLLVRPLLSANAWRQHRVHTIVFLIFLVANIGGMLSPLGDPPLFLGFLNGIAFFWPLCHLWPAFLIIVLPLLLIYYLLDRWWYRREPKPRPRSGNVWRLEGGENLLWLAGVIIIIMLSGLGGDWPYTALLRDGLIVGCAALAYWRTPVGRRQENHFRWQPFIEVLILFFGLFMTLAPVQAMLRVGADGAFAPLLQWVQTGDPATRYFWFTGILSAFLDNAPTYMVFLKLAGGNALELMTTKAAILKAISLGAVLMGALTYIGNAPNLMIKTMAEQERIAMPGFLRYLAYACLLLPLYYLGFWCSVSLL